MTEADRVDVILNGIEEVVLATFASSTLYAYPSTTRTQSSISRDQAVNEAKDANQVGLTGTSIIDSVIDFAKTAWGIGKKLWSAYQSIGTVALAPVSLEHLQAIQEAQHKDPPCEEVKRDDFTPIDLPKDRRMTMPRLLSVDDSQTPRASRK
jgi:hypothetical protein